MVIYFQVSSPNAFLKYDTERKPPSLPPILPIIPSAHDANKNLHRNANKRPLLHDARSRHLSPSGKPTIDMAHLRAGHAGGYSTWYAERRIADVVESVEPVELEGR